MDITHRDVLVDYQIIKEPALVRPKNIARLIFILCLLNMTSFYCGYCIAYITALGSQNLVIVYGPEITDPVFKGFLIACIPFGVSFGALLSIKIVPKIPRRKLALILAFIGLTLQGIIQISNVTVFFVGRFLQGTVTGVFLILVPIYIRQITPKQINKKGIFGAFTNLFVALGIMMAFGFNSLYIQFGLNQYMRWRIIVCFNFVILSSIIICILFNIIPQSPNSLIQADQYEKAKQVIGIFNGQKFVDQIFKQKIKQIQDSKKKPLLSKNNNKKQAFIKTFLTFQLPVMHQLTGVNAYISQMGFVTSAYNFDFGNYVPVIMGSVQFFTALFSLLYLYRLKRKNLILIGNLGMGICCIGMGLVFLSLNTFSQGFWIVVSLIITFMAFNGLTLIPSVPLYTASIGAKKQLQYVPVVNWFSCGTAVVLFPIITSYYRFEYMFFSYGSITLLFFIVNSFLMVQTKPRLKDILNIQLQKL